MVGIYAEESKPPRFPWYKQQKGFSCHERLKCGVLSTLDTSSWIAIGPGLDDFRHGPPNPISGLIKPSKPSYRIKAEQGIEAEAPKKDEIPVKRGDSTMSIPKYKQKRITVENIEARLQHNPLVLFPYLESDLPFEVFTKLIGMVADPSVSKASTKSQEAIGSISETVFRRGAPHTREGRVAAEFSTESADVQTVPRVSVFLRDGMTNVPLDPYHSFLKRVKFKGVGKTATSAQPPHSEEQKTIDIVKITEEFCQWIKSIGGEDDKYNIDPDKIFTLFDIDDKPTVVSSIQVLDKQQIPAELLVNVKMSSEEIVPKAGVRKKRPRKKVKDGKPQRQHYRYGAWYLPVTLWKKLEKSEMLEDPIEVQRREEYLASFETKHLDKKIANLYSTKALRSYINKNGIKLPKFLKNVPLPEGESIEASLTEKGSSANLSSVSPGKS